MLTSVCSSLLFAAWCYATRYAYRCAARGEASSILLHVRRDARGNERKEISEVAHAFPWSCAECGKTFSAQSSNALRIPKKIGEEERQCNANYFTSPSWKSAACMASSTFRNRIPASIRYEKRCSDPASSSPVVTVNRERANFTRLVRDSTRFLGVLEADFETHFAAFFEIYKVW